MAEQVNYCENFGWQWQRFRKTQIDQFNATDESRRRFLAETEWHLDELPGQCILDAGCGAGRFTAVAREAGAKVVSVDLAHGAAAACARNLRELGYTPLVVQASLYALPFKHNSFDRIFSLGVMQHTPDPERALAALPSLLKPDGKLALWVYEKRWTRLLMIRNYLRTITRRLPWRATYVISYMLVAMFFPLTLLISRLPALRRLLPLMPIAARHYWGRLSVAQQWEWTLLDTFDSYSARYEHSQPAQNIMTCLLRAGMVGVRRNRARGMAIIATRSLPDH